MLRARGGGDGRILPIGLRAWAADLLAGLPERLPLGQWSAWLSEAADCLADARTRLEPRFVHERGAGRVDVEPGRFDPERLAAVESAWRDMVRERGAGTEETSPRVRAEVSMVALQVQLESILAAIRGGPLPHVAGAR